jgi:hypothetical protein
LSPVYQPEDTANRQDERGQNDGQGEGIQRSPDGKLASMHDETSLSHGSTNTGSFIEGR